jgi:hypothetical protein
MEESVWSFDVDDLEDVPDAVGNALRELDRQGVHVVEGTHHRARPNACRRALVRVVRRGRACRVLGGREPLCE